jgi:outer membrane protein
MATKYLKLRTMAKQGVAFTVLAAMSGVSASTVYADDLLGLWRLALEKDAKYQAAKHQYLADKEVVTQAKASLLPTVAYQYEYMRTDQEVHQSDNAVFAGGSDTYPTKNMGLTVTQSLFDFSRWQRFYLSKSTESKAEAEFMLAKQELLMRLVENYFLVLEHKDQLETIQAEKAAMSGHLNLAEKKLKTGLGKRVDVEDARARYLNALSKEVELQSRFMDAEFALWEVVGKKPDEVNALNPAVKPVMPEPNAVEEWVKMANKHNLKLQVARLGVKEAENDVEATRASHYPTLDLVYSNKNTETEGSVFGGGSDISEKNIILQMNMPLYTGGQTSSKVRQAIQRQYGAQEFLNEILRNVERTTNDAYYKINAAIIQIKALAQSLVAQERMLQTKSSGYRSGRNNILEVLDVQQDLSQVQQALTKARYDYVLNILRLKYVSGELGESDLANVNGWLMGRKRVEIKTEQDSAFKENWD